MKIDVSVIIPIYNAEKYISTCVQSVLAQTLKNIEIILVDDGSTDSTPAILDNLAEADSRIRVIHQKNGGAGNARNTGLCAASGKYLSFLDSDDFFDPCMLEKAFRQAETDSADLVLFKADFFNEKTGVYTPCIYGVREELLPKKRPFAGTDIERDIFKTVVGWAWDKLFRTDFVRENGFTYQEQRTTNDMLFVFSALVRAQRITVVPEILAHQRRQAGGSLSVTREKSWMCFYNALIALRQKLQDWNLYERFEQDYINYALHFSLWNLNTLKDPTRKLLYYKLKQEWFAELGIKDYPADRFYHSGEYAQYKQIMLLPYGKFFQRLVGFAQRGMTFVRRRLGAEQCRWMASR